MQTYFNELQPFCVQFTYKYVHMHGWSNLFPLTCSNLNMAIILQAFIVNLHNYTHTLDETYAQVVALLHSVVPI